MALQLIISGTTAVGIVTLVIILFKSKNVLNGIKNANTALTDSLRTHKEVVENLPNRVSQNVSKEVRDGIDPTRKELENLSKEISTSTNNLIQSLSESHNVIVKTLTTINTDGSLTEWVESLRETIDPLQSVTAAIEQHYQTSENLLDKIGELIVQWTTQRQVVENAFTKFSSIIEEWAVKETTHRRDIEDRIMERLAEVRSTNEAIQRGFSELQSSQTTMSGSQQELSNSVKRVSDKLGEIIDTANQNQNGQLELTRNQKTLQDQLETLQIAMQSRWQQFENLTNEIFMKLNDAHETFVLNAQKNYDAMVKTAGEFHEWHKEKLESVTAQHETMIGRQLEIADKHDKLIINLTNIIDEIPSKKTLNIGLILFVIHMLITGVIAYGILSR